MTQAYDVAITGGGFSGAMVMAHLARLAPLGTSIIVFEPNVLGRGPAYETTRPEHLLNVRAGRMSAYENHPMHFVEWCKGRATISPEDFAPRMLYGAYLADCIAAALSHAQARGVKVHHQKENVAELRGGGHIRMESGHEITARHVVCATGFSFAETAGGLITAPWKADFEAIAQTGGDALLIGTGLTAVDTIMSLLNAGFKAEIRCLSRTGKFPHPHSALHAQLPPIALPPERLRLSELVRFLRTTARAQKHWQDGLDALRPHTRTLWNSLPDADKKRALARYFTWWNIHRHRMAPSIHARLMKAIASGQVRCIKAPYGPAHTARHVFDCRGPSYRHLPPYLAAMISAGEVRVHPSGAGVCVDDANQMHENIYAIGALLLGEQLETTAVPELRTQAAALAAIITARLSA